jgi:hypothetical protein
MDISRRPSFKLDGADRSAFFKKQTVEVEEKKSKKSKKSSSGEEVESTPIHRHAKYADKLVETPSEDIKNLSDAFQCVWLPTRKPLRTDLLPFFGHHVG